MTPADLFCPVLTHESATSLLCVMTSIMRPPLSRMVRKWTTRLSSPRSDVSRPPVARQN